MKKITFVLALLLVFVSTFSLAVSANPEFVEPNPPITIPYSKPTVDGNIDMNEGWDANAVAYLNDLTTGHFWAHNPLSSEADLYYAFDDEGIYVAANIREGLPAVDMTGEDVTGINNFVYSTGEDTLDLTEEGLPEFGWNGDVMGIMFDPFGGLKDAGFIYNSDFSAWYLVGLHEGDIAKVYRSHVLEPGEITDQVEVAGKKTDAGWCFEVKIPWQMIIDDTFEASLGDVDVTIEQLVKEGTYFRVGSMYHDRYYDAAARQTATWGRYIVVPKTLPDGLPGQGGSGDNIAAYGIELYLGALPKEDTTTADTTTVAPDTTTTGPASTVTTTPETEIVSDTVKVTDADGKDVTDEKGNVVTSVVTKVVTKKNTTSAQNKGNSTGANSSQTIDMTVAIALGTLAISGVGIVASKKRR